MTFEYAEMTKRNIGFVTEGQQDILRRSRVFVCGAGGMGGACLQTLVRSGVGAFEVADFDRFEVSNLNRQVFATMDTVGQPKALIAALRLNEINPEVQVRVHEAGWVLDLENILRRSHVVVNAMDDILASIRLYRMAAAMGVTVIDAYASTLPSVYVTKPENPRPEERLAFPTVGIALEAITKEMVEESRLLEIAYVFEHSSSSCHGDQSVLDDVIAGRRPRISFAPMVILTGNLMAYEAIFALCGISPSADGAGYFFNPYIARIEQPGPALCERNS